jgi:S1-C subfamily serine protease
MPDADSASFSRACDACGRRVPRNVARCRCGAQLPEAGDRVKAPSSSAFGAGFRSGIVAALGLATMFFGMYWFSRFAPVREQPAAAAPATRPPEQASLERLAPPPPPPTPPVERVTLPPKPPEVPSRPGPASLEDVISDAMPAVVLIETSEGRGSGFYVRPDTLLTNIHVVGSNSSVIIKRMDGTTVRARVELRAPEYDIAVLKVSNPAPAQALIPLGSTNTLRVGQDALAIGSALGTLKNTVTRGIVSAVRRSGGATLVQTDAAVNPGNSGGPLLDRNGSAIGITTMGYTDRQGLNFAVGIEHARDLLEGRHIASSTSSITALDDVRGLSPSVASDADRIRTEGQRSYEEALKALARRADSLDSAWRRFRAECYGGPIVGSFDREWFSLLVPRALPGQTAIGCGSYQSDLTEEANTFKTTVVQADEAVRKAGVYPGEIRDLLRKYKLNHEALTK